MAVSQNYTLGRGRIYFGRFKKNTRVPELERYFGNTPEFNISVDVENLDHYSSDQGVREKDDSVALQTNRTGTITTDSINLENLSLFFFGESSALTTTASTNNKEVFTGSPSARAIQLGVTQLTPVGIRGVEKVKITTTPNVSLEEIVDYTLDLDRGRIMFENTDKVKSLTSVEITYDVKSTTRNRVLSGANAIEGSLRYIANNPKGENFDYFMPWVKLTPNGDFSLKGDDWQTIPFNVEILKKEGLEAVYLDSQPFV